MSRIIISLLIYGFILFVWTNFNACKSNGAASQIAVNLTPSTSENPQLLYKNNCSGCHGEQMEAFTDRKWLYGESKEDLIRGIKEGYPDNGMPAFGAVFTDKQIEELAQYILTGIKNVKKYEFDDKLALPDTFITEDMSFRLETVVKDSKLKSVWDMAFLPNEDILLTEKFGTLYRYTKSGELQVIKGTPEVISRGQGGLMDVELHPDYKNNALVYLSYSIGKGAGANELATTAIMRAKLEGNQLVEQKIIFEALPYSKTRHHYGARMEFDKEGFLYLSVGDRGNHKENPQNLDNHCGKIHRVDAEGNAPNDNPFVNKEGALPTIYSYGHRNPQGMVMNPTTGKIWTHEHGPRGGDEINIINKSLNYGWPLISYGINYDGTVLTNKTEMEGMEQPLLYWVPSIAPCGMTFVKGGKYPAWEGDLLVGSLRFKYLNRCKIVDNKVVKEEMLLKNIGRVRSVEMSPEGYIYVSVEDPGVIYKLVPLKE